MSNDRRVCQCGQKLQSDPKYFNLKKLFFVSALVLLIAIMLRQTANFGKGTNQRSGQKIAYAEDSESENECRVEISRYKQMLLALEMKLAATLQDKMSLMQEKLLILQQNRESEERIIHTLATMRDFQDDSVTKQRIIDEKNHQIGELQKEIEALKQLFVDAQ